MYFSSEKGGRTRNGYGKQDIEEDLAAVSSLDGLRAANSHGAGPRGDAGKRLT